MVVLGPVGQSAERIPHHAQKVALLKGSSVCDAPARLQAMEGGAFSSVGEPRVPSSGGLLVSQRIGVCEFARNDPFRAFQPSRIRPFRQDLMRRKSLNQREIVAEPPARQGVAKKGGPGPSEPRVGVRAARVVTVTVGGLDLRNRGLG
jgi:hypothetical protein